ncbi:MAG: murein biosynthesis integral membrane protein MurJ [Pseudomonadales bacterium]|jgi:putative peptidoglycan lipid II flippase|nr:murein biosynthesis integral membrane protein MurJ [Pseudomonadales bacterium]
MSAPSPVVSDTHEEGSPKNLLRSSVVTSGSTLLSRILGLARETVFAALFGDGAAADAFFIAFRIPNLLRRLFAEGAFSQAFVPVLAEYRAKGDHAQIHDFVRHVSGALGTALLLITVLGVILAPWLSGLFAPGFIGNTAKFELLVAMLQVTFPYILLISLTGFAGAILNSYGNFAVPALTPVILNVVLIVAALAVSPLFSEPTMALAWGVLIAGFLQFGVQLPFLRGLRLMPWPRLDWKHSGVNRVLGLMVPVLFSVSVGQINLLLDSVLATSIQGDGNVSWLYYSDRLMELPLGMFAVGIATVILPALSRIHNAKEVTQFSDTLQWGLRCVLVLGIPASAAFLVLADPLIVTLFQYGAFGVDAVAPTRRSLQAYSIGLVGFMAIKVLASGYFSRQDTRTPVRYGVVSMVSNMALNLLFILPLAHVGLALATSLSALLNAGLLLRGLVQRQVLNWRAGWVAFLLKLTLATVAMVVVLLLIDPGLETWLVWRASMRVLWLLLICGGGALVYGGVLLACGVRLRDFRG